MLEKIFFKMLETDFGKVWCGTLVVFTLMAIGVKIAEIIIEAKTKKISS